MVNVELLKAEMEDVGITKAHLAKKCNMSRQTLNNKLENPKTITAEDALAIASALRINDEKRLMSIFFAENVEKNFN